MLGHIVATVSATASVAGVAWSLNGSDPCSFTAMQVRLSSCSVGLAEAVKLALGMKKA
jgi:hypothetical protein